MSIIPQNLLKLMSAADRKEYGKAGWTIEECQQRIDTRLERKEHILVVSWCAINEIPCRHDRTDRKTSGNVGWPDFTIIYHGCVLLGEMKVGRNKLSPDQNRVIAGLLSARTAVQIWHGGVEAIKAIKTWLTAMGWEPKR